MKGSQTGPRDLGGLGAESALQLSKVMALVCSSAEGEALKQVSAGCETSSTDSRKTSSEKESLTISQKLTARSFFLICFKTGSALDIATGHPHRGIRASKDRQLQSCQDSGLWLGPGFPAWRGALRLQSRQQNTSWEATFLLHLHLHLTGQPPTLLH